MIVARAPSSKKLPQQQAIQTAAAERTTKTTGAHNSGRLHPSLVMRLRKCADVAIVVDGQSKSSSRYDSGKTSSKSVIIASWCRRPALPFLALLAASVSYGLLLHPSSGHTRSIMEKPRIGLHLRSVSDTTALATKNTAGENLRTNGLGSTEEKLCEIWLAPSSLKGHTGFGIYTTRDINKEESILSGPDGPSVPVVDYEGGPMRRERREWIEVWDNYWWGRGVSDHVNYESSK